ncbi:MAG: MASE1 domain-containing protein [Candidatus Polarisedimenticolia bacterium]
MAAAASEHPARRIVIGLGIFFLYILGAWPALYLTHTNNASPVWPASGVALAAAVWRGPRVWPWIFAADVVVGALSFPRGEGTPGIIWAILIAAVAAGDTLEPLAVRWLFLRTIKPPGMTTVRGVCHLFRAAPVGCVISATIGTICLQVVDPTTHWFPVWFTWWTGDVAGCLVVGPALYLWARRRSIGGWGWAHTLEYAALLVCLAIAAWIAFGGWIVPDQPHYPLGFMVVPFLVWSAVRFGPREAATSVALSSGIVTLSTATGSGPFWVGAPNISVIVAQAHILVVCGTILTLAGAISDRRRALRRVSAARHRLERKVAERTAMVERQAQQLRVLASRLAASASRIRQQIASVLHEDLQQLLVAARMQAARQQIKGSAGTREDLDHLLGRAIATSRDLALQLIPPVLEVGGLKLGLMWLTRRMKDAHDLEVELVCDETIDRMDREASLAAFDAVRELLFNVVSHAGVGAARIQCAAGANDHLSIEVSDQGRGFDPGSIDEAGPHGPLGLYSLRERLRAVGGSLRVDSTPGRGTRILLSMPRSGEGSMTIAMRATLR